MRGPPPPKSDRLQAQLDGMARRIQELEERAVVPTSVTVNTNNLVVINNFGQEDISFLNDATLKERFLDKYNGILKTVQDVNMNPDRPENHNVRILSRKRNVAESHVGGAWLPVPLSKAVDDLIRRGHDINSRPFIMDKAFQDKVIEGPMGVDYIRFDNEVRQAVVLQRDTKSVPITRLRQTIRARLTK